MINRFTITWRTTLRAPATRLLCVAAAFGTAITTAAIPTKERDAIYRDLQQPILVQLVNKRMIPGHSINVSGEQIIIGTSEGAGEIIFTFKTNEVDSFDIPGESYKTLAIEWMQAGETENALELMAMLYQQRVQLIPLLPPSESHFFIYYIELILQSRNPARAIAVTEVLRPQVENSAALRALDDALLESYHTLELYDEARPLAEAWLAQRDPFGASALGYYVLSADMLRAESYNEALDLALQPIVFSSPMPTKNLEHCYAVAISAALGLRDIDYANTLYNEMKQRKLVWPENDQTLAPFHQTFLKTTSAHEANTLNP